MENPQKIRFYPYYKFINNVYTNAHNIPTIATLIEKQASNKFEFDLNIVIDICAEYLAASFKTAKSHLPSMGL